MFSWLIVLGIALIAVSGMMVIGGRREGKLPRLSGKGRSAGNSKNGDRKVLPASVLGPIGVTELNLDAFDTPDLAVSCVSCEKYNEVESITDFERVEGTETESKVVAGEQAESPVSEERPRIIGDSARELGMRYFKYLLAHHVVPRGATHLTNESNIQVAENALRNSRQSVTLSHGAVAQNIGERVVCLFEPLENAVSNVDKALDGLSGVFDNKTVFVITANTEDAESEKLAHLGALCKRFKVQSTCLFIEQSDGSFINYTEDSRDFVPSRIDVTQMPQTFFSDLLDYAYGAYDEGDYEAVLRTIEPLMETLYHRIREQRDFPKVLLAQALNLLGMTHRTIGHDEDAIACFELSLTLLREIEDYEAIKSVLANLGITLALFKPVTLPRIDQAIRHLSEVIQLNPRDEEAWLYLANSYLEKYRLTSATSLLNRALRAYERSYALAATEEKKSCMEALRKQIGGGRSNTRVADDSRVISNQPRDSHPNQVSMG